MIKVQIMSDLHLEFMARGAGISGFVPGTGNGGRHLLTSNIYSDTDAEMLILAGDIQIGCMDEAYTSWFVQVLENYKHVLYIPGNHEFYKNNFYAMTYGFGLENMVQTINERARNLGYQGRLYYMHNKAMVFDDVVFMGSTLWTSYNNRNPIAMAIARDSMNDYKRIKIVKDDVWKRFTPEYVYGEFKLNYDFLDNKLNIEGYRKKFVITHHSPTFASIAEKFKTAGDINYAYASELPELMERADYWVHGHIHQVIDTEVYGCRLICNPYGYASEGEQTGFDARLVVEV